MANTPMRPKYGVIQPSAVAAPIAQKLRFNGAFIYSDDLPEFGTFVADNVGYITFPVGAYTYRLWNIGLTAPAAIAGKTDVRGNENVVKTANIADYIDRFVIEINGKNVWEMTAAELAAWNDYQMLATTEGELRIPFGSPGQHNTDAAEDAYMLGTQGLRSLRLRVRTKPGWVTGMKVTIGAEFAPVARPIGYFQSTTRYSYTAAGAGNFTISDLAVGIDFAQLWVSGNNITDVDLTIDRRTVMSCTVWKARSLLDAWGKDSAALGNGVLIDAFRDGDSVGFDSVSDQVEERKRGAEVRLDLNMTAGGTVNVLVFHCGLFNQQ